jgi:hypothetical protein
VTVSKLSVPAGSISLDLSDIQCFVHFAGVPIFLDLAGVHIFLYLAGVGLYTLHMNIGVTCLHVRCMDMHCMTVPFRSEVWGSLCSLCICLMYGDYRRDGELVLCVARISRCTQVCFYSIIALPDSQLAALNTHFVSFSITLLTHIREISPSVSQNASRNAYRQAQ